MTLRTLHRISAIAIAVFAFLHITNHLVSLFSVASHIAFMEVARVIYRQQVIEAILLFLIGFQIISGLWFVVRGWTERHGLISWLQAISGTYLAVFFFIHISAIMVGRFVLKLDTNFYYAAAGFHVPPYPFFFAPYYFLAVLALFVHLGCVVYRRLETQPHTIRNLAVVSSAVVGGAISLLIVLSLAGVVHPVDVPAKYKATFAPQNH